jgi:hypothetical protein
MIVAFIVIITIGTANVSLANDSSKPAELLVTRNSENHPVCQLRLHNLQDDEFNVTIKDANSNILYSDKLKGKNISKDFRMDFDEQDLNDIQFVIRSKKTKQNIVYKITNNTRTVNELMVAKL